MEASASLALALPQPLGDSTALHTASTMACFALLCVATTYFRRVLLAALEAAYAHAYALLKAAVTTEGLAAAAGRCAVLLRVKTAISSMLVDQLQYWVLRNAAGAGTLGNSCKAAAWLDDSSARPRSFPCLDFCCDNAEQTAQQYLLVQLPSRQKPSRWPTHISVELLPPRISVDFLAGAQQRNSRAAPRQRHRHVSAEMPASALVAHPLFRSGTARHDGSHRRHRHRLHKHAPAPPAARYIADAAPHSAAPAAALNLLPPAMATPAACNAVPVVQLLSGFPAASSSASLPPKPLPAAACQVPAVHCENEQPMTATAGAGESAGCPFQLGSPRLGRRRSMPARLKRTTASSFVAPSLASAVAHHEVAPLCAKTPRDDNAAEEPRAHGDSGGNTGATGTGSSSNSSSSRGSAGQQHHLRAGGSNGLEVHPVDVSDSDEDTEQPEVSHIVDGGVESMQADEADIDRAASSPAPTTAAHRWHVTAVPQAAGVGVSCPQAALQQLTSGTPAITAAEGALPLHAAIALSAASTAAATFSPLNESPAQGISGRHAAVDVSSSHRQLFEASLAEMPELRQRRSCQEASGPLQPAASTAVDALGRDLGCAAEVAAAVPEVALLQFGALLGEEASLQALAQHGSPWAFGEAGSLFGAPDHEGGAQHQWERIITEARPGLTYQVWRRPLRCGLFIYTTRVVIEGAVPADVRVFNMDDQARFLWDDTPITMLRLPLASGAAAADSCIHYYRVRFPMPMAARQYVYARRVWDRPSDGGCYSVSIACQHPGAPQRGRAVHVSDYASCCAIRSCPSERGFSEGATEIATVYFEDSGVRAALMNIAVRKGLWAFAVKHEAALRVYTQARHARQARREQHAAARRAVRRRRSPDHPIATAAAQPLPTGSCGAAVAAESDSQIPGLVEVTLVDPASPTSPLSVISSAGSSSDGGGSSEDEGADSSSSSGGGGWSYDGMRAQLAGAQAGGGGQSSRGWRRKVLLAAAAKVLLALVHT